jgi:peptide/nickel transport system substrate-binding protein
MVEERPAMAPVQRSRRAFVQLAVVGLGAGLLVACQPAAPAAPASKAPASTGSTPAAPAAGGAATPATAAPSYIPDIQLSGVSTIVPQVVAPAGTQPQHGGVLVMPTQEIPHLDPTYAQSAGGMTPRLNLVYDQPIGPVLADNANNIKVGTSGFLAESYEARDGNQTWVFHIRGGVHWHNVDPVNGREFNAADWKWGQEYVMRQGSVLAGLFSNVGSVDIQDPLTVVYRLKEPDPSFLSNLSGSGQVVFPNREAVEKWGDVKAHAIGTGPFILVSNDNKAGGTYRRNPDYWDQPKPYLDGIQMLVVNDSSEQQSAFRTGHLDGMVINSPGLVQGLVRTLPAGTQIVGTYDWYPRLQMAFRFDQAPYSDVNFRRAFAMSIDFQKGIELVYGGMGYLGSMPPWGMLGWQSPPDPASLFEWWRFDPQKARQLLAQAGFPNGYQVPAAKWYDTAGQFAPWVSFVTEQLKTNLNVDLNPQQVDFTTGTGLVYQGAFQDMFLRGFLYPRGLDVPYELNSFLLSTSPLNRYHINDPLMDDLARKASAASSLEEQQAIGQEAYRRVLEQVYWLPFPNQATFGVVQPYVKQLRNSAYNAGQLGINQAAQAAEVWLDPPPNRPPIS